MPIQPNNRHTGARKYPAKTEADASDAFSQDAATNRKPVGIGLSEPVSEVPEKTRHADGRDISAARPPQRC